MFTLLHHCKPSYGQASKKSYAGLPKGHACAFGKRARLQLARAVKFISVAGGAADSEPQSTSPIHEAIAQLQRQLAQFRSTQSRRTKEPESLWQAAVELARQHGVYPVAHPRLDYARLKKRLDGSPGPRRKSAKPAFVELIAPHPATLEECVIEFESTRGGRMRIRWKAAAPPDWASLLHAWQEVEG